MRLNNMTVLYSGSGASGFETIEISLPEEKWIQIKEIACKLLLSKGSPKAAEFLNSAPFNLLEATNYFGDEFKVLQAKVPIDTYLKLLEFKSDPDAKWLFREITKTFLELGFYVRHIDVLVSDDCDEMVSQPAPKTSTQIVEKALRDSQQLLLSSGAASAVDRVHTALHGYLKEIFRKSGISFSEQASITALFRDLRQKHPSFISIKTGGEESKRILGGLATVVDCLNTLRNKASYAHSNEEILEEAEAILAINCVRTLFHYLDRKLR